MTSISVRHGEHDVEIRHVEQFRLTVLQPLGSCETLAFWTIPVAAGVVGDALMAAVATTLNVTAEGRGAAILDRPHRLPPRRGQRCAMPVTKSRAEAAEHIRHFHPLAGHENRSSGGHEVRHGWNEDAQQFQRTGRGADGAGGDHEILSGGAQITMTEQQLDGAYIGPGFQ